MSSLEAPIRFSTASNPERPVSSPRSAFCIDSCMLRPIAITSPTDFIAVERSEEHTSELQSLMRISYAVFCLKKKKKTPYYLTYQHTHSGTANKRFNIYHS